jgi:hypothetical protein
MSKSPAQLDHEIAEALASERIKQAIASYKPWTQRYSNEDFDRYQELANTLTEIDRAEGSPAPAVGYSKERYALAKKIVDSQTRYR